MRDESRVLMVFLPLVLVGLMLAALGVEIFVGIFYG
jgi:hypothetical protein